MDNATGQEVQFLAPYNAEGKYHRSFYNISELQYYQEFDAIKDDNGEYDLSKLDFPFILLTYEEWQEALTGLYGVVDGQHSYTPHIPTAEEKKKEEITAIDAKYAVIYAEYLQKGKDCAYLGKTTAAAAFLTKYNAAMENHLAELKEVELRYA